MWRLYLTAKGTSQRPSDLVCIADRWAALQFDNAVTMVGNAIENASMEREKVGGDDSAEWRRKYTMQQLLEPDFRLPLDDSEPLDAALMDMDGAYYDEV